MRLGEISKFRFLLFSFLRVLLFWEKLGFSHSWRLILFLRRHHRLSTTDVYWPYTSELQSSTPSPPCSSFNHQTPLTITGPPSSPYSPVKSFHGR
ncbi:hypothetical protein U1Q18_037072 [Sarracenia purpurea var. burkii]